jgi:predicted RNA polymerase sigma factor
VTNAHHTEGLLRELAPQVLGVLARRFSDFDAAEDAVQEALLSATLHWPTEGIPDNPRRPLIVEGTALLDDAITRGAVGEYQLQAAIAALHDRATRVEDTDWPQILALYELLDRMTGNPVVALNRAIAAAMVHGPAEGLRLLEPLDERLCGHYRLDAVRAHLFEMDGDLPAAIAHYRAAAGRTTSGPERYYLTTRAARLNAAGTVGPSDEVNGTRDC